VSADGDRDGLPNVLLEAQSQGLAVVSTPVGGIPELLDDEVNGLLVPARDPAALAAAIRRLMEDPLLRKRFGEEGQKRVRERFSLQSNIGPLAEQFGLAEAPASAAGLAAGAN
jgi:glycosyltransferase involved in cell wall biosynthesis